MGTSMQIKKVVFFVSFFMIQSVNAGDVHTVKNVDLGKYIGAWYEIASIPQFFQRNCVSDTTANYSIKENGLIQVENFCMKENSEIQNAIGEAKIVDNISNSKLKVTFVKIFGSWIYSFGGDYWVIDLAEDYRYAVVGHPSRKYGWILSRSKIISNADLKNIAQHLVEQNYNLSNFMTTPQEGGINSKMKLNHYFENQK